MEYGLDGGLGRGEHWAVGDAEVGRVEYGLCGNGLGRGERGPGGAAEDGHMEYGLCGGGLGQGERKGFLFVGGKLGLDCGEGYSNCLIVDDAAGLLELLEDMLAHLFLHDDVQVGSVNVSAGQLWLPRTATRV